MLTLLFSIHQMLKQGMQVLADSCPSARLESSAPEAKAVKDSSFQAVQSLSNSQTYNAKVKHEDTFYDSEWHPSISSQVERTSHSEKKTIHIISKKQHSQHLFLCDFSVVN